MAVLFDDPMKIALWITVCTMTADHDLKLVMQAASAR